MTIRFAASRCADLSAMARRLSGALPMQAANDNAVGERAAAEAAGADRLLRAALRHFAEHGLSAAEQARQNAEDAFFAGKSEEYRWWLAICSALDRRMASAVEFRSRLAGR